MITQTIALFSPEHPRRDQKRNKGKWKGDRVPVLCNLKSERHHNTEEVFNPGFRSLPDWALELQK